jgi:hypothetical protein
MQAAGFFEISVNFYQATCRYIPADTNLHFSIRKNVRQKLILAQLVKVHS